MKFVDLVKSNSWLSVEIAFLQYYPEERKSILGYEKVFNDLRVLNPIDTGISILVSHVIDDFDNSTYVDVSGYYIDPGKSIDDLTNSLALEFTPWEKWLGMDIDKQSLRDFSDLEIISHCLFEMTFVSFDQKEIQAEINRITDVVDEIKKMSGTEKEQKLIPLDEVIEQIDKRNKTR